MIGTSIGKPSSTSPRKETRGLTSGIGPPSGGENSHRIDQFPPVAIPILLGPVHRVADQPAVGFQKYVASAMRHKDPVRVQLEHALPFHREDRVLVAAVGFLVEQRKV